MANKNEQLKVSIRGSVNGQKNMEKTFNNAIHVFLEMLFSENDIIKTMSIDGEHIRNTENEYIINMTLSAGEHSPFVINYTCLKNVASHSDITTTFEYEGSNNKANLLIMGDIHNQLVGNNDYANNGIVLSDGCSVDDNIITTPPTLVIGHECVEYPSIKLDLDKYFVTK